MQIFKNLKRSINNIHHLRKSSWRRSTVLLVPNTGVAQWISHKADWESRAS